MVFFIFVYFIVERRTKFSFSRYVVPTVFTRAYTFSFSKNIYGPNSKGVHCPSANLQGLSGKTEVIGEETVEWLVREIFGNKRKIRTPVYYLPATSIRIFSPHTFFKEKKAGSLLITHDRSTLTLNERSMLDSPYQESNIPLMLTEEHFNEQSLTVGLTFEDATVMASMDVSHEMNQHLTAPHRELMMWHLKWAP
jgi:hypothetical protein